MNLSYTNLLDPYINAGKWYGFFAGMGMSHRWPAVRLGGVAPPDNRAIYVPFTLAAVANAVGIRLTITGPSGATATQICTLLRPVWSPLMGDSGSALMKMDYLNSSGMVVAPGDNVPLYVQQ